MHPSGEAFAQEISCPGFERVVRYDDSSTGLSAIVAIHNTTRGPALGGVRMRAYGGHDEALTDALRLARSMTYKSALADLALGGGKCVVLADPAQKSEALLVSLATFISSLGGRYIPGIDSGTSQTDMRVMQHAGAFVSCVGRDPSPFTALGTFAAIQSAARRLNAGRGLVGLRVVVQGIGHVGREIARLLILSGAEVIVSDIQDDAVCRIVDEFGVRAVSPEDATRVPCDVFAPCALGGVVDDNALKQLDVRAVVGAANNVLAEARHGVELHERGVLYGPDFCINAGGVILLAEEMRGAATDAIVRRVRGIGSVVEQIWDRCARDDRPAHEVALDMADARLG